MGRTNLDHIRNRGDTAMYRRWLGIVLLGALVFGVTSARRTAAEDKKEEKQPDAKPAKLPADLDFVYESGNSFVAVRPNELLESAPLKQVPARLRRDLDRMTAAAPRSIGLAITDIDRVSILLPTAPTSEPVAVVRTAKAYDRDAVIRAVAGPDQRSEKYKGYTLQESKERHGMCLCAIDGQSFAVGRGRGMKDVLDRIDGRSTSRPHGVALEWAVEKHQVVLGAGPEAFLGFWMLRRAEAHEAADAKARDERRSVPDNKREEPRDPFQKRERRDDQKPNPPDPIKEKQGRRTAPADELFVSFPPPERFNDRSDDHEPNFSEILVDLPVAALPYKPLLSAKSIAATLDLGDESKVYWRITFEDEGAATDGEASARVALYVLREALGRLPREVRIPGEENPKLQALVRDVQTALKSARIQRRGATLEGGFVLKTDEAALKPFFAELEKTANRFEGENHLKQIGIAMHSYHDAVGTLPNAAICDENGKPLLSWRVAILPYIEEDNLYKQFNLREPWDSPTNIKLMERMPAIYGLPNRPDKFKYQTFFRVFTGPNTPFDLTRNRPGPLGRGLRLTDFTDGTSNTLLVVEAAESVPWTKPDELPFNEKGPMPKLGGLYADRFLALFADGSVRTIGTKTPPEVLRAVITPNGGEIVDPSAWEDDGRPPRRSPEGPRDESPVKPPQKKKNDTDRKP
jgi:hypothetical protein